MLFLDALDPDAEQVRAPDLVGEWATALQSLAAQVPPWCSYLARIDGHAVGIGGFKGLPDRAGVAEIGYLTFIPARGKGVATALTAALVEVAKAEDLAGLCAHTLPESNASTAVLEANGFARVGEVMDPEDGLVWRWERKLS